MFGCQHVDFRIARPQTGDYPSWLPGEPGNREVSRFPRDFLVSWLASLGSPASQLKCPASLLNRGVSWIPGWISRIHIGSRKDIASANEGGFGSVLLTPFITFERAREGSERTSNIANEVNMIDLLEHVMRCNKTYAQVRSILAPDAHSARSITHSAISRCTFHLACRPIN